MTIADPVPFTDGIGADREPRRPAVAVVRDPLVDLATVLGLEPIASVTKYGRDGNGYVVQMEDGQRLDLGSIKQLLNRQEFKRRYLTQMRRLPPVGLTSCKPHEWDEVAASIEELAIEVDTITSTEEETRAWIEAYAMSHGRGSAIPADTRDALADALRSKVPFRDAEGRLHLHGPSFIVYLARQASVRTTATELSERLARLGFTPGQPSVRDRGDVLKLRMWISPPGFEADR